MGQVLFIVWRESIEAMLVVGILNAWLRSNPAAARGRVFLWGGVLAGLALAALLAFGLFAASEVFADKQELFQLAMVMLASVLIVQMVLWMRRHGRTLKRDIEQGLSAQAEQQNWWGVLTLAALAVGREGSETVVFLYGTLSAADHATLLNLVLAGMAGFLLALAMYAVLQLGSRVLSWRVFFRITEVMLLLLAGALFVSGVEKMISLDWLPALMDPVWDSSRLLDDSSALGGVLAALTGYRAHPALTSLLGYGLFWLAVWGLMRQRLWRRA
ncbi:MULTISPECIES: FTR1 family protein [unclassified Paludibacterium]|uniref:FTR1 family iron permease n=1 Tax=unclassified Paludibacterium TaxID=2618429 RepID=UPI001C05A7DE|nr:FTR1 family protein [Paludibacterium sp. B53371]BEV73131.1 FTR1 family protein [Paludibacterium sp. THUN1379]